MSKMTSQRGLGIHVGSGISALNLNKATRIFLEKTTTTYSARAVDLLWKSKMGFRRGKFSVCSAALASIK